jgi:N-acetylglutamate synthase
MIDEALIATIEQASGRAWPTAETIERNGWRLCYGGAQSRRLNSVQTHHFDDRADVGAAIDHAAAWYAAHGQPACFRLTDLVQPTGLDALLAARDFARLTPTSVMMADAAGIRGVSPTGLELLPQATTEVLVAISDSRWSATVRAERVALFSRLAVPHQFALVRLDDQPAAGGLCVRDGDLAGIFSMRTQPPFRRRGLARAVLLHLAQWARAHGARRLYLQVEDDNVAALPLYRQMGFNRIYGYHYRELPRPFSIHG